MHHFDAEAGRSPFSKKREEAEQDVVLGGVIGRGIQRPCASGNSWSLGALASPSGCGGQDARSRGEGVDARGGGGEKLVAGKERDLGLDQHA